MKEKGKMCQLSGGAGCSLYLPLSFGVWAGEARLGSPHLPPSCHARTHSSLDVHHCVAKCVHSGQLHVLNLSPGCGNRESRPADPSIFLPRTGKKQKNATFLSPQTRFFFDAS